MPNFRLPMITLFGIAVLTIACLALAGRTTRTTAQDDPIIVKGGSLTITCPGNTNCLGAGTGGKYSHTNQSAHITRIVVKATNGAAVFDSSATGVNVGGQPSVEIFYR